MHPARLLSPWLNVDPELATRKARYLRDLLIRADTAIEAQQRIIEHEGPHPALQLELRSLTDEKLGIEAELGQLMTKRQAETLRFALDGPRYRDHQAPAGELGKVLDGLSNLYVRVCQSTNKISQKIPKHLPRLCELKVAAFYPSSFGIELTVVNQPDLIGESLTLRGLEETFRLITADDPAEVAAEYGPWTIKKYRELVTKLIHAEATPVARWTTSFGDEQTWEITDQRLLALNNKLTTLRETETKVHDAEGLLLEASLIRHTFGVASAQGTIKGKVPRELGPKVAGCFNQKVRIVYEERRILDENTEQEKKAIRLLDITSL